MIAGNVGAAWLDAPLRRFVQDSRVQRAVVLRPDGEVLGQFGFQSSTEVRTACALAAAINASGRELGNQLAGRPFLGMHQGGRNQGVFMGLCDSTSENSVTRSVEWMAVCRFRRCLTISSRISIAAWTHSLAR